MTDLPSLFSALPHVVQAMIVLSIVAALGLAFGNIRVRGISIGIGGVLFAGILVGHFGVSLDHAVLEFIREFGLILFVYTIGIQVGPGFFAAFRRDGLMLNGLAAALVVLGVVIACAIYLLADLPLPVVLGLFSGGVTNTPSLGAAQQMLIEVGAGAEAIAQPGLGYAVAYPFGIAGILLAMGVIRFFLRIDPNRESQIFKEGRRREAAGLETMDVAIRNGNLDGMEIRHLPGLARLGVVASRLLRDGAVTVPIAETTVTMGDVLRLVGPRSRLEEMRAILGEEARDVLSKADTNIRWERIVVTDSHVLGKSIAELDFAHAHHVAISRVNRSGIELSPNRALKLQFGDILSIVGTPENIRSAASVLGNSERRLQQVDLIPVFIGIALGVLVGSIPIFIPGIPAALKLGLAGGPLVMAIILSRIGHIGPLVWFMPPIANHALREIGIVLFLAVVGLTSGGRFVETLIEGDGLLWMALAALITFVPLVVVGFVGRLVLKLNYLTVCGLLSGSMTDPPALAFANQIVPGCEASALAYATVYPLVMCLRILAPQIMVLLLWSTT